MFSWEFCEFLWTPFLQNTSRRVPVSVLKFLISLVHTLCPILVMMFQSLTYVSSGRVHNNNTSFHHFLSRAATHKVTFEGTFMRNQLWEKIELWYNLKSYDKINIRYLYFPGAHHDRILPNAEDIAVTSKSGIWNFFNNCYLSLIIHTLLGIVCQRFLPPLLRIPMW